MPSSLRARLRRAVLGKTDAKIARQQRQLDAQAKELTSHRVQQTNRQERLSVQVERALASDTQLKKNDASLQKSVAELTARLSDLSRRVDGITSPVATLTERANKGDADMRARDVEFELRRAQLGTVETRLSQLEQQGSPPPWGRAQSKADTGEALDLLAEIRREHEQIRVRMQIITLYEERLRRVEESLLKLYDGDKRHRL